MTTTLYKTHATGKIGTWSIWADGNTIIMETQTGPGAARTRRTEVVSHGKAGRTLEQQIQSRINSRTNKKLDNGYKRTPEEAAEHANTNTLLLLKPMLAHRKVGYLASAATIYAQPKLDGMRMIVTRQNGELMAYSRQGKPITTVNHILTELAPIVKEDEYLDGELYCHGHSLQTIMSWAKREQPNSRRLQFHVFDVIDDAPFYERFSGIAKRTANIHNTVAVPTVEYSDKTMDLISLVTQYRVKGFEGAILRNDARGYEPGKRSTGLIKVKHFVDDEFTVLEVTTGAMGMPVLVCQTANGKTFSVTAPGTHAEKQWALENPEFFVGYDVTVRHVGFTGDGIPFHPVCVGRRLEA